MEAASGGNRTCEAQPRHPRAGSAAPGRGCPEPGRPPGRRAAASRGGDLRPSRRRRRGSENAWTSRAARAGAEEAGAGAGPTPGGRGLGTVVRPGVGVQGAARCAQVTADCRADSGSLDTERWQGGYTRAQGCSGADSQTADHVDKQLGRGPARRCAGRRELWEARGTRGTERREAPRAAARFRGQR